MRKGSKLLRMAFTRADISTIYRALKDYSAQLLADESLPRSVRAMEAADVDQLCARIVTGIAQLGGLEALQVDAPHAAPAVDAVAAKHSKRMRSRNGAK